MSFLSIDQFTMKTSALSSYHVSDTVLGKNKMQSWPGCIWLEITISQCSLFHLEKLFVLERFCLHLK